MTTLNIYAAGSLRLALPAVGELFKQFHPINFNMQFAPAGLLCEKLMQSTSACDIHLFASANTQYPQTLVDSGKAVSHHIFTHNRLCLTVRNQPQWANHDAISLLRNPQNRIGMSTPQKDPSGDYTFMFFDKIEAIYPNMGQQLKKRARQLVGGSFISNIPKDVLPAQYFLLNNTIDIFIGYANYAPVIQQNSQLTIIDIPNHLLPTIEYSIAQLNPTNIVAKLFIDFLQNKQAQECLLKYGFS